MTNAKSVETKEIKFYDDTLLGVKDENGNVYLAVKKTVLNIGLSEDQARNEIRKIQESILFKSNCAKFDTVQNEGGRDVSREVVCLLEKYVPMWLAQINITPKMKLQSPEAAEKLLLYQMECAEILSKAFLGTEESRKDFYDRFDLKGELQELELRIEKRIINNVRNPLVQELGLSNKKVIQLEKTVSELTRKFAIPENESTKFEKLRIEFLSKIKCSDMTKYKPLYDAFCNWTGIVLPISGNIKQWLIKNVGIVELEKFVNGVIIDRIVLSKQGNWVDLAGIYENEYEWNKILKYYIGKDGNYHCAYCKKIITLESAQREHLINKRDLESSDRIENIVCSCSDCNQSKGEERFDEWYPKQSFYSQAMYDYLIKHICKYSI